MKNDNTNFFSGLAVSRLQPGKALGMSLLILGLLATVIFQNRETGLEIDQLAVHGEVDQAQRKAIYEFVKKHEKQFFDIDDVKTGIESIGWVHHVNVLQIWPDKLSIEVVREQPIAYWNDDAFINVEGKVFESVHEVGGALAQLRGPVGSEAQVMKQYQQLTMAMSPVDQTIEVLTLDERGSWQFTNQHDIRVLLGKNDIMERVHRFVLISASNGFATSMEFVRQVDTRYSNGIAVEWKDDFEARGIATAFNTQRELKL